MEVLIENRQKHHNLSKENIRKTAKLILSALDYPDAQLSILIVDDAQIAALNETYLNHSGPTNVISFPMQEGDFTDITPNLLGDVVISVDTAQREATEVGMTMGQRFNELLIHGILHLVGYDHVNAAEEAARMEAKSCELMDLIDKEL